MAKRTVAVVRQLGGIGDVIAMSCVYRGLKEQYPDYRIQLLCGRVYLGGALLDVAEHNPFIDEIHVVEPYDATTEETRKVWAKYFANCPHLEDELIWQKAEIKIDLNCACVEYEWRAMLEPSGIVKPRYQIWCDRAGVVPSTYAPVYRIRKDEQSHADTFLREKGLEGPKLVGVGVSSCDSKRAMGIGRLHTVCEMLREAGCTPVTIDPTFKFDDGTPYIIGKRVSELMPIMARMAAVVTVDSGLLHMAGTVGTPVIGLFGPTDYKMRMGMYRGSALDSRRLMPCAPCWYQYHCLKSGSLNDQFKCMNKIKPEIIVEETLRWIDNS
jgi:hypothetical protein